MNWDISIGRSKQWFGRTMQWAGERLAQRSMVMNGEALEFAGRLQMRYGMLKHQAQWGDRMNATNNQFSQMRPRPIAIDREGR